MFLPGCFIVSEPYKSGSGENNSKLKVSEWDLPNVIILFLNGAGWEHIPLDRIDPTTLETLVHQYLPDKDR